jgi:hypothetical protein
LEQLSSLFLEVEQHFSRHGLLHLVLAVCCRRLVLPQ